MKAVVGFALITTLCAGPAAAAPTTFFGEDLNPGGDSSFLTVFPNSTAARTAFVANTSGIGTETFESIAGGTMSPTVSFAVPGGTVTATLSGGTVATARTSSNQYAISGTHFLNAGTNTFTVQFSAPVAAFGFYGVDVGDFGDQLSLALTTTSNVQTTVKVPHALGSCTTTPCTDPTSGSVIYFGFYDTAASYKSISFINTGGGGDVFGFDDFSVGTLAQINPVPEPASWAFLAFGIAAVAGYRVRATYRA